MIETESRKPENPIRRIVVCRYYTRRHYPDKPGDVFEERKPACVSSAKPGWECPFGGDPTMCDDASPSKTLLPSSEMK